VSSIFLSLRTPRYELLAVGGDGVEVEHDPARALILEPAVRDEANLRCAEARRAGRKVENHPLYRVLGWEASQKGLRLSTAAIDYETYFGLSVLQGRSELTTHSFDLVGGGPRVEVLAVAAATEVDGCLVLEQRGQKVAQGAGMLHVKPSGHMHPPQTAWEAVLAETEEELGVTPTELLGTQFLGLVRSLTAPCIVAIYRFKAALSWKELLARRPVDAWEYEHLLPLRLEPDLLEKWLLESFAEGATGPGHATVLLEGRARYGQEWFEQIWRRLQKANSPAVDG
jgi:hypothetical protein